MTTYQAWSSGHHEKSIYSAFHKIDNHRWAIAYVPTQNKSLVHRVWKLVDYERSEDLNNDVNGTILNTLPASERKADNIPLSSKGLMELLEGASRAEKSQLQPGQYFPRIWRGKFVKSNLGDVISVDPIPLYGQECLDSVKGAISVFEYLMDIFRYTEPSHLNAKSYGNKIREALILACTEVEANWVSIYRQNLPSSIPKNDRYSTNNYVELRPLMRLDEWSVSLTHYKGMGCFRPFENWQKTIPKTDITSTSTIPWYAAYNKVKHDREQNAHEANLHNLLEAMAALHIMICAQWGPKIFGGRNLAETSFSIHASPFQVDSASNYDLGSFYMAPLDFDGKERAWQPLKIEDYLEE